MSEEQQARLRAGAARALAARREQIGEFLGSLKTDELRTMYRELARKFGIAMARRLVREHIALKERQVQGRLREAALKTGSILVLGALVALGALATSHALARPSGQWADEPVVIREWFRKLMQPDAPMMSCCGEADAYEADSFEVEGDHYVAIITDGHGVIPNGTRIPVPNRKMKFDAGNPTGHGILFLGSATQVYCYVTPGGA